MEEQKENIEEQPEKKGFFKKLFSFIQRKPTEQRQEEETTEEIALSEVAPVVQEAKPKQECFYCRELIYEGDRWSKQMGNWFHRKCYKQFLNAGKRGKL